MRLEWPRRNIYMRFVWTRCWPCVRLVWPRHWNHMRLMRTTTLEPYETCVAPQVLNVDTWSCLFFECPLFPSTRPQNNTTFFGGLTWYVYHIYHFGVAVSFYSHLSTMLAVY